MSPHVLEHLAKEKGFVQRKSKYQAKELVALCVWLSQQVASTSLTQLCSYLEVSTGILISPEGLNQRFNASAVKFLEQVLANLLAKKIHSTQKILHQYTTTFKHIRILDSTTLQLPDKFSSHYQGSGGSSHTAGVKIQLEYDLLSGKFLHVYVGEGRENDKTFGSTSLQTIRPKDLYIRDLGYFDLHDLQNIHNKGGYYISRLKLNSRIYRQDLAGEQRQKITAVKPQSNPLIFVYADESGKTGSEAYLIVGSVWFNDMQRHQEVQHDMRAWLAENRERAQQEQIRFPNEFHFTEMKKNQLELYKQFFDKVMQFSDMMSFKAVTVRKSQIQYKTLEQSVYSLYYQLAHLGIEHEVQSGRLSLPRSICYYKDADDGSDKLHLEETRQLLRERFKSNYEEELRLEIMSGMPSKTFVVIQIADLITGAVSRKLNMPEGNNHKDQFAEYILERLNVDYIRHEVSEIDNGQTAANIEFKQEQDMFYVHIFE
ncbi:IS4 family transposase [Bacillus sp. FJAT-51639]|uniref:IS4 family transposase n=1 Tax=Bacillus bruguierae TaxID=3127667 RepID=A0ABU8FJF5_9BACI